MKNKYFTSKALLWLIVGASIFSSCTKTWITEEETENNREVFQEIWNDINDNYIFFDQKEVDWNKVKEETAAKLEDNLSKEDVFEIFSEMLSELQDGHVSLYSSFDEWKNHDIFLGYPSNYDEEVIQSHYLNQINSQGPFVYDIIDDNIGYLRYSSFGDDISDQDLTFLRYYFNETKGLIIDIRGNLGGAADNVAQLLKLSLSEEVHLGNIYSKVDRVLTQDSHVFLPSENFEKYDKSIVVLTNRKCYSSCNVYAGYVSQLDGVSLIGGITGGGSGLAVARELGNGWQYRFSAGKITLVDDTEIENGVSVDIEVSTDESDAADNKDAILDTAIEILR